MSKFHTTMSRRQFMKGLGLAGAGLGAAAATTPVFHDLDEVTGSPRGDSQHRWWVKEVDEPTIEIDWNMYTTSVSSYRSPMAAEISAAKFERQKREILDNVLGASLKDFALSDAGWSVMPFNPWDGGQARPPEDRGVPRHQGSPEENLRMVRAALHYLGSPRVGVFELDQNTRKLITGCRFEDVDVAYTDGKTKVVPNKCKYVLTFLIKQSDIMSRHAIPVDYDPSSPLKEYPIQLGTTGITTGYSEAYITRAKMQRFLKCLGYQALTPSALPVPCGVLAGVAELGRTSFATSPDYGNMVRMTGFLVTDLPLALTKPIDGGVVRFCKACKKCAETCPGGSLSLEEEPTWDVNEYEGQLINRPGIRAWRNNWQSCVDWGSPGNCLTCMCVCPFSHPEDGIAHPMIRAIVGTTSIFNGFFARMDGALGYSRGYDVETWWSRDLSSWKYDNLYGFGTAGW